MGFPSTKITKKNLPGRKGYLKNINIKRFQRIANTSMKKVNKRIISSIKFNCLRPLKELYAWHIHELDQIMTLFMYFTFLKCLNFRANAHLMHVKQISIELIVFHRRYRKEFRTGWATASHSNRLLWWSIWKWQNVDQKPRFAWASTTSSEPSAKETLPSSSWQDIESPRLRYAP